MNIQTCKFVDFSDLFAGLEELADEFSNGNPPFTWGDCNRSLVVAKDILQHLDSCDVDNKEQLETLRERVAYIGTVMYIDLEN